MSRGLSKKYHFKIIFIFIYLHINGLVGGIGKMWDAGCGIGGYEDRLISRGRETQQKSDR
jgi:hypothetical protein